MSATNCLLLPWAVVIIVMIHVGMSLPMTASFTVLYPLSSSTNSHFCSRTWENSQQRHRGNIDNNNQNNYNNNNIIKTTCTDRLLSLKHDETSQSIESSLQVPLVINLNQNQTTGLDIQNPQSIIQKKSSFRSSNRLTSKQQQQQQQQQQSDRRQFVFQQLGTVLSTSLVLLPQQPQVTYGGEIGTQINKLITESDLGISVRTSVVKGAQIIDTIDGKWEQFSDTFNLGTNRKNEIGRPKPKQIQSLQLLNINIASKILNIIQSSFIKAVTGITTTTTTTKTYISTKSIQQRIQQIATIIGPSYIRSGAISTNTITVVQSGDYNKLTNNYDYNFAIFVLYKSFLELIIQQNLSITEYKQFNTKFESTIGNDITTLLIPNWKDRSVLVSSSLSTKLELEQQQQQQLQQKQSVLTAIRIIDELCTKLVNYGLIAQYDQSTISDDTMNDWIDNIQELSWTIAIDDDITLSSQLILTELGYRLYPNYIKCCILSILQYYISPNNSQQQQQQQQQQYKIVADEYYMDTNYNSNPALFDVHEILININIDTI